MLDPVAAERGERELDRFIDSRAQRTGWEKANKIEALYAESVRRHRAKLRQENRWAWIRFHECLAHNHAPLADENRAKAAALLAEPGVVDASR